MQNRDPDLELWRRAQAQEEAAFEQLRRKYRPLVSAEIRKRLHYASDDDHQDISQCVWIAVWSSLPQFRGGAAFSTWLVGIVKNVAYDWLRRKKVVERNALAVVQEECAELGLYEAEIIDHIAVHDALKKLAESEREVNHLRYFLQLTDEEIAEQLAVPLGTVKSRLRAGLTKMRGNWNENLE